MAEESISLYNEMNDILDVLDHLIESNENEPNIEESLDAYINPDSIEDVNSTQVNDDSNDTIDGPSNQNLPNETTSEEIAKSIREVTPKTANKPENVPQTDIANEPIIKRKRGRPRKMRPPISSLEPVIKRPRGRPRKSPIDTQQNIIESTELQSEGYNNQLCVLDYTILDNTLCYKVKEDGQDLEKTMTSKEIRKQCPLNAIYYLESHIKVVNSLPYESIVKYGNRLKRYY